MRCNDVAVPGFRRLAGATVSKSMPSWPAKRDNEALAEPGKE